MTCIVGVIDKERREVWIGADSCGASGNNITIRKDTKVFKNGQFLIGGTSSFRMLQLLRFTLKVKKRKNKGIYNYMCTDFIDAVRKCFVDGGYMQKHTDGDDMGGTFLVAYSGRLFKVGNDFQVGEGYDNYSATGCGEKYAFGSLYSGSNNKANKRVLNALEAAEHHNGSICKPFIIKKQKY